MIPFAQAAAAEAIGAGVVTNGWGYVIVGYVITWGSFALYAAYLFSRAKHYANEASHGQE